MKFYATESLVKQSLSPCNPWDFVLTEPISAQIRSVKEDRQRWYRNAATRHNFYTPIEAVNVTQRVSKENPPHSSSGFVADYDIKIPAERISEAIKTMEIKPAYFETSLGGNFRLIWVLESPILLDNKEFATFVQQQAHDWLRLDLLPGLDRKAFEELSRLYCNGGVWEATGHGPVPAMKSQAFFVECGKKFRFKAGDDEAVPLDIVEKALREKYPVFSWPGPFEKDTQGPSFWVPGSESPMSAIVKPGGLFSFAAHAAKPFYSWSDLLGKDFTEKYQEETIARATADIWWDGKRFWQKIKNHYCPTELKEMLNYFKVDCRMSAKPGSSGLSQVDLALAHLYRQQRVMGAGPFVFRPPGLILFDNEPRLNTYCGVPIPPAEGKQEWGPHGNFPFISRWLDGFFNPASQLPYFLAAFKHYYEAAFYYNPMPGQNFFLLGATGIGKTLLNREVVGVSVGGFVDASDFLVMGGTFNSHLMRKPHWTLDDESPAGSAQAMARVHMMFKKIAANQQFLCNAKYELASMVEWMGRIGCTANLDFLSTRIVGPLDSNSLDKTNLFKCAVESSFQFPSRTEVKKNLTTELPCMLRWLLDWKVPDYITRDSRYGIAAFHEKSLLEQTYQSSPTASFKEVLIEFLSQFFQVNADAKFWEGTLSMLLREMIATQNNESLLRSVKMEQSSRYLEQIQKEGIIRCEVVKGLYNTRIWRFYRFSHERLG